MEEDDVITRRQRTVLLGFACMAVSLIGLVGCGAEDEPLESYSTELELLEPVDGSLEFSVFKRFRFSEDPELARRVTIEHAEIRMLVPEGHDFSFLDELEVYVRDPDDRRILIASSPPFQPGQTEAVLDVHFPDDLKPFVSEKRIRLAFVARRSRWFGGWPATGFQVRAHVTLRFELF